MHAKVRSQISMARFELKATGSHLLRTQRLLKVHMWLPVVRSGKKGNAEILIHRENVK